MKLFARFGLASGEGVTTAWDGFGRLISTTLDMDGTSRALAYQFDANGNRTWATWPDGLLQIEPVVHEGGVKFDQPCTAADLFRG